MNSKLKKDTVMLKRKVKSLDRTFIKRSELPGIVERILGVVSKEIAQLNQKIDTALIVNYSNESYACSTASEMSLNSGYSSLSDDEKNGNHGKLDQQQRKKKRRSEHLNGESSGETSFSVPEDKQFLYENQERSSEYIAHDGLSASKKRSRRVNS